LIILIKTPSQKNKNRKTKLEKILVHLPFGETSLLFFIINIISTYPLNFFLSDRSSFFGQPKNILETTTIGDVASRPRRVMKDLIKIIEFKSSKNSSEKDGIVLN